MTATEAAATQSAAAVDELTAAARAARVAARRLARCSGADRRKALEAMAASLEDAAPRVLAANAEDVARRRRPDPARGRARARARDRDGGRRVPYLRRRLGRRGDGPGGRRQRQDASREHL